MSHITCMLSTTMLRGSLPLRHHTPRLTHNTPSYSHNRGAKAAQFVEHRHDGADLPKKQKVRKNRKTQYKSKLIGMHSLQDGGLKHALARHRPASQAGHPSDCNMYPKRTARHPENVAYTEN